MIEAEAGLRPILAALDALRVPYYVTGSLASSAHGVFRYTNDVDLVADLRFNQVGDFARMLQSEFYADEQMIRSAVLNGRSFNVIHLKSTYKFDIFPVLPDEFHREGMRRRRLMDLSKVGIEGVHAHTASVEDTILSKLQWYKEGGGISDQKWHDLMSIVATQKDNLDREYLVYWARELRVKDLLDELLA